MPNTRLTAGTFREVWRGTALDGGATTTITTRISASTASLSRVFGLLIPTVVGGTPILSATPSIVDHHLAVTISNTAAPGNGAEWELNVVLTHSLQQSVDRTGIPGIYTIGGGSGGVGELIVENIAELRTWQGGIAPNSIKAATVKGYYTAGDGGGGAFIWTTDVATPDNTGTVIVPNALPRQGCWIRLWDQVDVKAAFFGALGDNTDQAARLQTAINYIHSQQHGANEHEGYHAVWIQQNLVLREGGKYQLSSRLQCVRLVIIGSESELIGLSATEPLLEIDGTLNTIDGLVFSGGRHHVYMVGPNVDGMVCRIINCVHMRTATGLASIALDPTVHTPLRGSFSGLLSVEHFISDGCQLISGGIDGCNIRDGWVTFDTPARPWLDMSSNLAITDVLGAPIVDPEKLIYNPWIRCHGGTLQCQNVRFGGEEGGAPILDYIGATTLEAMYSNRVSFKNCWMLCAGRAWATFRTAMPSVYVDESTGFIDSRAARIDAAAEASIYEPRNQMLQISMVPEAGIFVRDGDGSFIDVLRVVQNRGLLILEQPVEADNLSEAGVYRLDQAVALSAYNLNNAGSINYKGYAINKYITTDTTGGGSWNLAGALLGKPAGIYVFSLYVHSTGGAFNCGLRYTNGVQHQLLGGKWYAKNASAVWARIAGSFYHDPVLVPGGMLGIEIAATLGTTFAVGLFALHPGYQTLPWCYPGHASDLPPEALWAEAPPVAGAYQVGTVITKTTPISGAPYQWVCTASAPLTWTVVNTLP